MRNENGIGIGIGLPQLSFFINGMVWGF